jgi:hypothetical protein
MTKLEMPALDGRSPLGFLAALGLVRVLALTKTTPLRLSFSRESAAAVLHSPLRSIDDVVGQLQALISGSPGAAVVGLDPRFPFPAGQQGGDPMRQPRQDFRNLLDQVRAVDDRAESEWMPHLFTDLAVDAQGRADLTPYCAPSGKQNLRTFFDKPLSAVRGDPSLLHDALVQWRRVEGFTGEYLDHRVLNSAADDPAGRARAERGVPGATWLATMAIPLLRVAGDGQRTTAALWHRLAGRAVMIWPLWDEPLDLAAIRVMIEHPSLRPLTGRDAPMVRSETWSALKVFAVHGAERQRIPGRNFAGVLAPRPIAVEPS